jgi:hypothetical protein
MRTATAHERHRAHHIRVRAWRSAQKALLAALAAWGLTLGCAGGLGRLPQPAFTQASAADYVPVPFGPRTPPPEVIPPSPSEDAVWVDGVWEWGGSRYSWRYGSWVVPPPNARYARWVIVRREADGQLFFAPASWRDASGGPLADRSFETALGPAARARARVGGPPPVDRSGRRPRGGAPEVPPDVEDEEE